MSDQIEPDLLAFVERVERQLAKNGFPEKRVSFPIERLYEAAYAKGLNFNKALELLSARGVEHEKTTEKILFSKATTSAYIDSMPDAPAMTPELGLDPSMFAGLDPSIFAGLDPSALAGSSPEQLFAAAQSMVSKLGPEQLKSIRSMVEQISPEQRSALLEKARRFGLG